MWHHNVAKWNELLVIQPRQQLFGLCTFNNFVIGSYKGKFLQKSTDLEEDPWYSTLSFEKKNGFLVWWWRSKRSTLTESSASHQSFWPLFLLNEPPRDSSSLIPRYWLCSDLSKFYKIIFSRFGEFLWFQIINRTCHLKKNCSEFDFF